MASTYKGMVSKPNIDKAEYTIDQNYQTLYKRASQVTEECFEFGLITAAVVSSKEINTDTKTASIAIYMQGGLGKQYYHIAEFTAIDDSTTNLLIYTEYNLSVADLMKKLFTGECTECSCEPKKPLKSHDDILKEDDF
jgi:hypothetical protein